MTWEGLSIPQLDGFTGFIPPEGDGTYGVMLVGEAGGDHEARAGTPFVEKAPAGSVLKRLCERAGLERGKFLISNVVWAQPPRNWLEGAPWEAQAIQTYQPFRDKAFELYRPRVFVALGNVALKALTIYGSGKTSISHTQGYVLDGPYDGTWVIGTFHPSAIMQGLQGLSGVFMWALQRACDIARNGFVRERLNLTLQPSLDAMLAFERDYNPERHRLDFDIETPESGALPEEDLAEEEDEETSGQKREISFTIIRASLCYDGRAVSFPWQSPHREIATRMLASTGPKGVWNEDFDCPRLAADSAPVRGRVYDWMKLWKHLQPGLPGKLKCRALEFVAPFYGWTAEPWKQLNSGQPEYYSACDALALNQCGNGIERDLRAKGQWELFERHVVELYPVLQQMARNGLPYSTDKAAKFDARLTAMLEARTAELQYLIPADVRPSKQKQGYKKPPQDLVGLVRRKFSVLGQDLTRDEAQGILASPQATVEVERWCLLEPFNPNSPGEEGQLASLIKFYGHTIGKDRKSKKGTVSANVVDKLIRQCRQSRKPHDLELAHLLQLAKESKQLSTVRSRYARGWRPGPDGRIHATPGFWGKMFRVSWRRPNISGTIQDKQEDYIAAGFRECVQARPGYALLDADWRGIEAILTGWFAGDQEFMRLGRLGVHDYFTYYLLVYRGKLQASDIPSLALSDSDLEQAFKRVKREFPKDRDDSKHIVHGIDFGETAYLIHMLYEIPLKEAQAIVALHGEVFPKVKQWQLATMNRASRESRLRNPFGYEMPFWEVFKWESKRYATLSTLWKRYLTHPLGAYPTRQQGQLDKIRDGIARGKTTDRAIGELCWDLGDDAKSALAFLPRDTAAAMLKEVCLRPAVKQLATEGIVLATHHDAFMAEPREADIERVGRILKTEMEAPVPELGGLSIGVELKCGPNWHDDAMETFELVEVTA